MIPLRRLLGAAILAGTIGITLIAVGLTRPKEVITIGFSRGERLADDGETAEQKVVVALVTDRVAKAVIVGYTAPGGDSEADLVLAKSRAQIVAATLTAQGIDAARLTVVWAGGVDPPPRLPDETDAAWGRRAGRVEVTIAR